MQNYRIMHNLSSAVISPLCRIASVVSWVTVKSAVVDSYLETPAITNGPFLVSTEALLMVPHIDKA